MGFSDAVQWWEEWQLRILVLTSLFLQCFLYFAGTLRKRCIPSWLRFFIWLAYLGSDAVAIYALATLFNRNQKQECISTSRSSISLEVLWAPILLVHLGGQDGITAYNIEDNELWKRHVLTAMSQVAVALYVFCKSWSGDSKLLVAGVLLFVAGILKCVLKPWDLKRVSINSLVGSSVSSARNRGDTSATLDLQAATYYFRWYHTDRGEERLNPNDEIWKPYGLFVDLAPSSRVTRLKALVHEPDHAHDLIQIGLSRTFDRLYTKKSLVLHKKRRTYVSCFPDVEITMSSMLLGFISLLRFLVTACSVLMAIFGVRSSILSHREAYDRTYVNITYVLLGVTVVLEYVLPTLGPLVVRPFTDGRSRWPDQIAQYNLIEYLARNKNHRKLRKLATLLVCKDFIDQLCCMKPYMSSRDITKLVHSYLAEGWTEHHIKDMATYRAFNDNRGQWTLEKEGCGGSLQGSLQRQFDESVLIWHLATDFCFHLMEPTPTHETARRCRAMSNYMVYLLFVNPEMLMTGARSSLFREAYRQLKQELPQPDEAWPRQNTPESQFAQKIAQNIPNARGRRRNLRIVYDAWELAEGLKDLRVRDGEEKMWRVIQGVWVEMLCFSAGRCRGYLHAKSLGHGGEYLSYIWLLLSYMGMETLAEKMQRTDMQEARKDGDSDNGTTSHAGGSHGDGTKVVLPAIATGGGAASPVSATGHGGAGTTEASPAMATGGGSAAPVTATGGSGDGTTAASLPQTRTSDR